MYKIEPLLIGSLFTVGIPGVDGALLLAGGRWMAAAEEEQNDAEGVSKVHVSSQGDSSS